MCASVLTANHQFCSLNTFYVMRTLKYEQQKKANFIEE